jgi:hypothetical protein
MRRHAEAIIAVRQIAESVNQALKGEPRVGSPYAAYRSEVVNELGPKGAWGNAAPSTTLKNHAMSLVFFSVDCLASSAELVRRGSYLLGLYPVARASTEASVALLTLVDDEISTRVRALRYALLTRAAAQDGFRNAQQEERRDAHVEELEELDDLLRHLVEPTEIRPNGWGGVRSAEGVELPSIRTQFSRFGEEIDSEDFPRTYGSLSSLAHPNSRRIEAIITELANENIASSVLNTLLLELGCLLIGLDRMSHFFGIVDDLRPSVELVARLGDALRATILELEKAD